MLIVQKLLENTIEYVQNAKDEKMSKKRLKFSTKGFEQRNSLLSSDCYAIMFEIGGAEALSIGSKRR